MASHLSIPTLPYPDHRLPPRLDGLVRIAYNLYWSWHPEVRALFARIDRQIWAGFRSPVAVLRGSRDWTSLLEDPDFMVLYQNVLDEFDAYMANGREHWFARHHSDALSGPVAYFCAEYGLHETLPIYSGGLGVLAGDHCKAASDMALPFVAVGLCYRRGYFRQAIDADGHQEHDYINLDPTRLPLRRVVDRLGEPLSVGVELPGRTVHAAVWLAEVGRVPLLLLDTDIPENGESDRPISHILYVRGREMRLHQELILGIGGVRTLRKLGITPSVWHLNEGHSAFLLVEQARELVAEGATLEEAMARVRSRAVFTIHTPVPAGNERFAVDLVRRLTTPAMEASGVDLQPIIEQGRGVGGDDGQFDMTAFALRNTAAANGVSQLHGHVANETWSPIIDHAISGITNGVHPPTWVGRPMRSVIVELGGDLDHLEDEYEADRFWERLEEIPDRDMWEAHLQQKQALQAYAQVRLRRQLARHGEAPGTLAELADILDPEVLTVGFARRMATYKRAALVFTDIERLIRLSTDPARPVQFIFAGKAHPADRPGQGVIQTIFEHSRSDALRGRVFILEDYDMRIARYLVQGVDVWLNNPRRPLEASGTSGMKAAINGVVNVSILDGWWDECYDGRNGWAIGSRESNPDEGAQDWADAQDLYRLLEQEIVPLWYERDAHDLPVGWLKRMRGAASSSLWQFSTTRMLAEYVEHMYLPAAGARRPGREAAPGRRMAVAGRA
ncbi:MAG TPA: alpha-glucan family phosphorylase [Candidatus Limnocylindrales bacterium]|nr:alpha-glucan family phosphorylase [Candidatus Limnocylindrales bacterium]